ncbi:CPBP family intramembrane metalloprotease [Vulcanisaeta distributa]|uniref:CPBP family intramembrane glutamic endopeptidase n=1 Tax=Vulcanisaeta distributa TaxID=164451 RepID=UPI0006D1E5DA|nr:CPBP family intramembrane glutamic endopeptidase [Vulcanisaeta distributa]
MIFIPPQVSLTNILIMVYTLYPIAVSEEVVFRGFMLNRLLPRNGSVGVITAMPAVIIDAIYFTVAHVPVYLAVYGMNNVTPLIYTLAYILVYGGVISGVIFISTRNVIPDIIIHWINDYLSIITVIYLAH